MTELQQHPKAWAEFAAWYRLSTLAVRIEWESAIETFSDMYFEMKSGVLIAYLDSVGMPIVVEAHRDDWSMMIKHNRKSGKVRAYADGFATRQDAQRESIRRAFEIREQQLKDNDR